jgi:transposase
MSPNTDRSTWKQERRRRAFELRSRGWKQRDIAEALGVSEAAVSQWFANDVEGEEAWRGRPHTGRAPRLSPEQLRLLPDKLWHGAEAYGYLGDVWTCSRVATVIRVEFGISYSASQVSRILKKLRWTPQIPIQRAAQRKEAEITAWRDEVWPELKKSYRSKTHSEAGQSCSKSDR